MMWAEPQFHPIIFQRKSAIMSSNVVLRSCLIVDDSPVERACLRTLLLSAWPQARVLEALDADEALAVVGHEMPDVVLTELCAPNLSGFDLISALKNSHPELPVIMVTKLGRADTSVAILHQRGDGYVPKSCIQRWLIPTIEFVCEKAERNRNHLDAISFATDQEFHFIIPNDFHCASALVAYLQDQIEARQLLERSKLTGVVLALHEAFSNAIYHGKLDLSSDPREEDGNLFYALADLRRSRHPYCDRQVHVHAILDRHFLRFVIRDEGCGFDVAAIRAMQIVSQDLPCFESRRDGCLQCVLVIAHAAQVAFTG